MAHINCINYCAQSLEHKPLFFQVCLWLSPTSKSNWTGKLCLFHNISPWILHKINYAPMQGIKWPALASLFDLVPMSHNPLQGKYEALTSNTTCLGCVLVCTPTLDSNNQQDHAFHLCLKRDSFWMSTAFKSKVSSKKHVVTWKTSRIRIKPMLAHACGT